MIFILLFEKIFVIRCYTLFFKTGSNPADNIHTGKKILILCRGSHFFLGAISLWRVVQLPHKLVRSLLRYNKNLNCKGEPYPYSSYRDHSKQTNILWLLYQDKQNSRKKIFYFLVYLLISIKSWMNFIHKMHNYMLLFSISKI